MTEQGVPKADSHGAQARSRAGLTAVPTGLSTGVPPRTARRSPSQSVIGADKPERTVRNPTLALQAAEIVDRTGSVGRSHAVLTLARLEAFIAVVEEGTVSAAGRRLYLSQPAVSQTVNVLERQLGVQLLLRSNTGVRTTAAGMALLAEARAILTRHDQMVRTVTAAAVDSSGVIRLGIPDELPTGLLRAVARFATDHPGMRVIPRHLPMTAQLDNLRRGNLDVSLMREHPAGNKFDTMLVARENLGILLAGDLAAKLSGPEGIRLNSLAGLQWIGLPRSGSPAWYDELAATLRSHGIDTGNHTDGETFVIPSVTLTALSAGQAFAFASQEWSQPLPETVVWRRLADYPVVRRTWAVWPAESRNRDVAQLIAAFDWCPTDPA